MGMHIVFSPILHSFHPYCNQCQCNRVAIALLCIRVEILYTILLETQVVQQLMCSMSTFCPARCLSYDDAAVEEKIAFVVIALQHHQDSIPKNKSWITSDPI